MRDLQNIREVTDIGIDMIGFIFYPQSPRYIGSYPAIPQRTCAVKPFRVGVFVNAPLEQMIEIAESYSLDYLQLHGNESPDTCYALQKRGFAIIKSFPIATEKDLEATSYFENSCDYFLFDTKCPDYGGSGRIFDWSILSSYKGETPFLLSGGITPDTIDAIYQFKHTRWAGIDLNSGFEIAPAQKDIKKLQSFIKSLQEKEFTKNIKRRTI